MTDEAKEYLSKIAKYPHLLGHIAGYNDLSEIHSEWIHYIWNTEEFHKGLKSKRSLQAHRGSFKTSDITEIGIIWNLLFNPDDTIGIFRKDFTDASLCLKNISRIMKLPKIKYLFKLAHGVVPEFIIDRAENLTFNFKSSLSREGSVNAYSIMNPQTGTHLRKAIFDDFVTIEDKISKAIREKTKVMLEEAVENIVDPDGLIGFIGTPWHKEDAWKICPEPKRYDVYSTGILSEVEIEQKRKSTTNMTWALNYELRHGAVDDAIFKEASFDRWEFNRNGIGHIDKKYFGTDTMALTFIEKKQNGRWSVFGKVYKENIKDKIEEIKQLHKKYMIGTVYSEDNDDKGLASDLLRNAGIPITNYHESTNKHVKIMTHLLENGFWNMIDFDPDTDPEYIIQILDYVEGGQPDDAADSLSCLGRILITSKSSVFTQRWKNI